MFSKSDRLLGHLSPDGKLLASIGAKDGDGKLWDTTTGQEVRTLEGGTSDAGAKLVMAEPHLVPVEFELTISGTDPRPARKIWFKGGEMGVKFL